MDIFKPPHKTIPRAPGIKKEDLKSLRKAQTKQNDCILNLEKKQTDKNPRLSLERNHPTTGLIATNISHTTNAASLPFPSQMEDNCKCTINFLIITTEVLLVSKTTTKNAG